MRRAGLLLCLASALLLGAAPAGASAAPAPWRAAGEVRDGLFEAQEALLFAEDARARAAVEEASEAFSGSLRRRIADTDKGAAKAVRDSLAAARRATARGDETALAAARGTATAALVRGSYAVTTAAVAANRPDVARDWLLLRDFRKATRYSPPTADATAAVTDLAGGRARPPQAGLGVRKDLLDAYQARLVDSVGDAAAADERGFDARRAELAAHAAGLWPILAPEYARQRGPEAAERASATFDAFAAAARRGDRAALARERATVGRALDAFTAAPFTSEEQARRAQQLLRFLELIPIEYRDGTDDGRVTIPFELQEAVAFQEGALSAFSDLEAALRRRDARQTASVEADLGRLRTFAEDARSGRRVVPEEDVEEVYDHAAADLEELLPEEWQQPDEESEFELIDLTLDRMEAAASAGQQREAEQARLEAYAFFEFGPELRLRPFDAQLVSDIESRVWFGSKAQPGLAKVIAERAPRREVRESRLALDRDLETARGVLGEGASPVTVVVNSAIVVFREGLEAVLILAAVTASFLGANRRWRRPVFVGALLALLASVVTWVLTQTLLDSLSRFGEKLEAVVGLVAIGVLLVVMNWFFHRVYWTKYIAHHHGRRRKLLQASASGAMSAPAIGFGLLGFTSVYREGFETVLFLQALVLSAGTWTVLEGVALGMLGVGAVAAATFALQRKLPAKRMLVITGVLLGGVLVMMVGQTARTLQGVAWLSITPLDIDIPAWLGLWFGVFPSVETLGAQLAAGLFVIGSFFLAERMRRPRGRRGEGAVAARGAAGERREATTAAAHEPGAANGRDPAPVATEPGGANGREAASAEHEPAAANGRQSETAEREPAGANGSESGAKGGRRWETDEALEREWTSAELPTPR